MPSIRPDPGIESPNKDHSPQITTPFLLISIKAQKSSPSRLSGCAGIQSPGTHFGVLAFSGLYIITVAGEIDIVENGISRRVNNFEAIVLQLWLKAMAGTKRATNVLLQYQAFAARRAGGMGGVIHRIEIVGEDASEEEARGQ